MTAPHRPGRVSGLLQEESAGPSRSIPGTVTLAADSGRQYTVGVPADGEFTLRVPMGTYTANGGSPEVRTARPDHAEVRCYDLSYIHVVTGAVASAVVLCRAVHPVIPRR